jgi:hypothetical protein
MVADIAAGTSMVRSSREVLRDRTPSGRPAGEIRQALRRAFLDLASARMAEGAQVVRITWREAAAVAAVGWDAAKRTADNMARAGELVPVGLVRTPGVSRAMVGYLPAELVRQALPCTHAANDAGLRLQQVFGHIARA